MYCSQKWKAHLDKKKLFISYKKKQAIFREGNLVTGISFIYTGCIKVYNTGKNNQQNVFRVATSGEMLGLRSFAEKIYLVSATALEDSSLCFFEKNTFFDLIKENPEFALHLIEFYAQQLNRIENRHRNAYQLSSAGKVAEALLFLKSNYGKHQLDDEILLDIVLTRQEIADIAGICMGEVIRTLSLFSDNKVIRKSGKKLILLKPEKLTEIILSNCCDLSQQNSLSDCLSN